MAKYLVKSHTPFNGNYEWVVESPSFFNIGQVIPIEPVRGTSILGTIQRIITEGPDPGPGSRPRPKEDEDERDIWGNKV